MREQVIECQDSITLACECGERIVLLGRATDWYDENRLDFTCECGNVLSIGDHLLNAENLHP
jgi:hypothetical protein